jgi:hypothetical protein
MNSTNSIVITIALALTLVGVQHAYATNESSYKYGFKNGFTDYRCMDTEGCGGPTNYAFDAECAGGVVTNSTACHDGYLDGWKSWCKSYLDDCLRNALGGSFPDRNHVLLSSLENGKWAIRSAGDPTNSTGQKIVTFLNANYGEIQMFDVHNNAYLLKRIG